MTGAEHVGMRIRMYRKQHHLTLSAFADLVNLSASTISKYESGKISVDVETLFRIADALEISINQLTDYRVFAPEKRRNRDKSNYFERRDLFYFYQYFGLDKKVHISALEIIRNKDRQDSAVMYYDIKSHEEYTDSAYIYYGTISCFDMVCTILLTNPYNQSDVVFIYAKSPFTSKDTTVGVCTGVSQSLRNPYSYKVLFSSVPQRVDSALIAELTISDKDTIADIRRTNAFFTY